MSHHVGTPVTTHHLVRHRTLGTPITDLTEANWSFILARGTLAADEEITVTHVRDGLYAISFTPDHSDTYSLAGRLLNNFTGSDQSGFEAREFFIQAVPPDDTWDGTMLCSVEALKRAIPIENASDDLDDDLARLIAAVSEAIQNYTNIDFSDHTTDPTDDVYNGDGGRSIFLKRFPTHAVDRVVIGSQEVPACSSLVNTGFVLDDQQVLRLRGYAFWPGAQNVQVTSRWGYVAPPRVAQRCCLAWSKMLWLALTKHVDQKSVAIGEQQTNWIVDAMPADVKLQLDQISRRVPV